MFNNFTAAIGAILISTACIAAAVGPAAANQRVSAHAIAAAQAPASVQAIA